MAPDQLSDDMAADDDLLPPGTLVGEYVLAEKIGQGGFGAVYRAQHPVIGKQVAIKLLNYTFSRDKQMVSRFIEEARSVNLIQHRNIIDIFGFGTLSDSRVYYVMEYLHGEPLDTYLHRQGPLTVAETVAILAPIARALDAAHEHKIAHRDIKPENIFLVADGESSFPKLLDFGIAKLLEGKVNHRTRTGMPMGTPHYMSPEQCRGRDIDHRTDYYSFGVLMYRMLAGRVPFDGEDFMSVLMQHTTDPAPPVRASNATLPPHVDSVVADLLEKDPARRPFPLKLCVERLAGEPSASTHLQTPAGPRVQAPATRAVGVGATAVLADAPAPSVSRNINNEANSPSGLASAGRAADSVFELDLSQPAMELESPSTLDEIELAPSQTYVPASTATPHVAIGTPAATVPPRLSVRSLATPTTNERKFRLQLPTAAWAILAALVCYGGFLFYQKFIATKPPSVTVMVTNVPANALVSIGNRNVGRAAGFRMPVSTRHVNATIAFDGKVMYARFIPTPTSTGAYLEVMADDKAPIANPFSNMPGGQPPPGAICDVGGTTMPCDQVEDYIRNLAPQ